MIGSLQGTVLRIDGMMCLLEVGSVGYEVEMPVREIATLNVGVKAFILIHHVIREDADLLYGFVEYNSRALFRELIKINGIGPKIALAILSTFGVDEFLQAVASGDTSTITRVPGIGKKSAERIVIEFKDKVSKFESFGPVSQSTATEDKSNLFAKDEALSALIGLGYKEALAKSYIKAVYQEGMDTREIIVKALAVVNKG